MGNVMRQRRPGDEQRRETPHQGKANDVISAASGFAPSGA
jgi:hypothetical protein